MYVCVSIELFRGVVPCSTRAKLAEADMTEERKIDVVKYS